MPADNTGDSETRPDRIAFKERQPKDTLIAAGLAVILTFLIFLLLPLSRILAPQADEERWVVRQIDRVEVPPPPPPEPEIRPTSRSVAPSSPDIRTPSPEIPLSALPIRLSVNPDPNLMQTASVSELGEGLNLGEEVRRYTFADLQGGPRVLSVPPVSIPVRLARRGFARGRVVFSIRILPDGSVEILDVVESSHSELIEAARRSASRARFEPPEINGQRVAVEGNWPLLIETGR